MKRIVYTPDKDSIKSHQVPDWYHDAKLGIFIHWGLFSVPAFAITGINLIDSQKRGIEEHFKNNPYAEWYLNTLRIPGSPTQSYHSETYGNDFSYDDFVPIFNKEIKKWKPDEWADLFKKAGAKYVVLVTKHHDGFLLWPSKYPNPKKKNYFASRDIVGELSKAVRKKGMKMGLYYSGSLDWSFNLNPISDAKSFLDNGNRSPEYIEYANNHWYELIDTYDSIILWNDIGYPPTNLYGLFAYFYNKFPEGLVNDRWIQFRRKEDTFPKMQHSDFLTPEYEVLKKIEKRKWESNRGIGNSYGYNKLETQKDYLSSGELIRMFVDIVSKNGNLLLNVGPMPDGTIPEIQKQRLLDLGKWLEVNGEAIYGTRPWIRAEGKTLDDIEVRFTHKEGIIYLILLDTPREKEMVIKSLLIEKKSKIQLLGQKDYLNWKQENEDLKIFIPTNLDTSYAYAFKIQYK
jgi:alpha-L-fucosidase